VELQLTAISKPSPPRRPEEPACTRRAAFSPLLPQSLELVTGPGLAFGHERQLLGTALHA
jgi:hypothetical protein